MALRKIHYINKIKTHMGTLARLINKNASTYSDRVYCSKLTLMSADIYNLAEKMYADFTGEIQP